MTQENDGASATENAVETQTEKPVSTKADLTSLFAPSQEPVETQVEEVAVEKPEEAGTEEVAEVTEGAEEIADGVTEVAEAETPEESGDVLSQHDKTLKKMRKRIDKVTKRSKVAEESIESLKEENENLKRELANPQTEAPSRDAPQGFIQKVQNAESIEELEELQSLAKNAKTLTKRLIRDMDDSGESEIEHNGQVFTRQDIYSIQDDAEEAMEDHMKPKEDMFHRREEYDRRAFEQFDFLKDPENDYHKFAEQVMGDPQFNVLLNNRADQFYILGLLAEGKRSIDLKSKTKGEAKGTPKAEPKTIAQPITGIRQNVAPARVGTDEKSRKVQENIRNKNNINKRDLSQLFM